MAKTETISGKTSTGFEFSIPVENCDDEELLDDLEDLSEGNRVPVRSILRRLIGEDGQKALYEHVRDKKTGKVKASAVMAELHEIFQTSQTVKNS